MKKINSIIIILLLIPFFSVFAQGGGNALNIVNASTSIDGDFVYCGSPNYNFTDKITVAAWVKWTIDPAYLTPNHAGDSSHEGEGAWATFLTMDGHITRDAGQFWLQHSSTSQYFEWAVNTSVGRNYIYSTTKPIINKWYYLVGTYDANATPKMCFYVNGVLENSTSNIVSGNIKAYDPSFNLNIGRMPSGYRFFCGNIDEVRIWNKALTLAEVNLQMYSKSDVAAANVLSYWNMDKNTGSSVPDSKGKANGVFYTALVDIHNCAPPTVPGGSGLSYGNNWFMDFDKIWTTNLWSGLNVLVVAGNGVGNTYTVSSNTVNTITLNKNFTTTPIVDNFGAYQSGPNGMTWLGIEDPNQSSQWVASTAPIANGNISGLTDICGIWDTKPSNTSSILTVSNTNIDTSTDQCVICGNNNLDFGATSSGNPSGISSRINRNWMFQINKSGGVTAKLSFNCSGLTITDGSLLRLLLSSSSDFSNAAVYTGTYSSNTFNVTISNPNYIGDNYFVALGSTGVLPVNLLSFNYSIQSLRNVNLSWKTNFELNNKGFDIERKILKDNNWKNIGFVPGKNSVDENNYTYSDENLNNGFYQYRLKQIDYNGNFEYFALNGNIEINSPAKFQLSQNYPNPFNPETKISYEIPKDGFVTLIIYDAAGREINKLINEYQPSGYYTVAFNGSNLPSSVYFYKLESSSEGVNLTKVMKCVLIK